MLNPLTILLEDAHLVAVDKPAGLAVIPGRAETDSLLERLGRQLGLPVTGQADPRLRIVHRLDKDTTGVLLLAKDLDAQRHLSNQFQNNLIAKEYLALVVGRPPQDSGTIDAPLGPHPTAKERMAVLKHGGRPAVTAWRIEQRFRQHTLLRCFPRTGKTHQIRVHLAHIGLPLAIDPLYGPTHPLMLSQLKKSYRPTGDQERPLISRLTLHAHRLTFHHPDGRPLTVESPLPKDLRATINQLGKLS